MSGLNQEPGDRVGTCVGLQRCVVVTVELVQHPQRGWVGFVRVGRRDGQHGCPERGRRQAARLFEPIRLPDRSMLKGTGARRKRFFIATSEGRSPSGRDPRSVRPTDFSQSYAPDRGDESHLLGKSGGGQWTLRCASFLRWEWAQVRIGIGGFGSFPLE